LGQNDIDDIRALLSSKPRPVGWSERRQRLDEVGSVWPAADDVTLEAVNCDGVPGEWSLAPGSNGSRVLIFFHGGGYCSGSILSHRRMVTEAGRAARMRTLAIGLRPSILTRRHMRMRWPHGSSYAGKASRPTISPSVAIAPAEI
jgi:epsilon-lactone hydrolase